MKFLLPIFLTILSSVISSFLEPTALSVSIPISVMGYFIMKEIDRKKE